MARLLPVALVQATQALFTPSLDEYAAEVADVVRTMPTGSMVVHPEVHLFGREGNLSVAALRAIAQPLDGDYMRRLGELAGDLGTWLVPGSVVEPAPDGGVHNTTVVFDPQGRLVARYRKAFPWRPSEPYTPGTEFTVFDVPRLGRMGIAICYDIWFPEVVRQLTWMGAEAIINVVRTTTPDRKQELVLLQANAIANQVYMLSVNAAGPVAFGQSLVVDPDGDVIAHASHDHRAVLYVDVDFDRVAQIRRDGTAGINRMWSQFRPTDAVLPLPIYGGRIDPRTWEPAQHPTQEERA